MSFSHLFLNFFLNSILFFIVLFQGMFDVLEPPRILLSSMLPTIKRIKPNDSIIPNRANLKMENNDVKTVSAKTENGDNKEERGSERDGGREGERDRERGGDGTPDNEESTVEMITNFEGL